MKYKIPQTLVRVGKYDSPLEEAIKEYSEPLIKVLVGLENPVKYATFKEIEEPYFLMVSQQKEKILVAAGYNVLLTITSYSDLRNQQVAGQFERETLIDLSMSVPEQLKRQFALIGLSFQAFERNPQMAMAVLRGEI